MGKGHDNRHRAAARRAIALKAQGLTHRQIAEAIGKKPEAIKGLLLLGERLQAAQQEDSQR